MNKLKYSTSKEVLLIVLNCLVILITYAVVPIMYYLFNNHSLEDLGLFAILVSSCALIYVIWDIIYFAYFLKNGFTTKYIVISIICVILQLCIIPYAIIFMNIF